MEQRESHPHTDTHNNALVLNSQAAVIKVRGRFPLGTTTEKSEGGWDVHAARNTPSCPFDHMLSRYTPSAQTDDPTEVPGPTAFDPKKSCLGGCHLSSPNINPSANASTPLPLAWLEGSASLPATRLFSKPPPCRIADSWI